MPIISFEKPEILKGIKLQKANYYTNWSVANIVVLGILLASVMITFFYVYKNIYSLYNNAATIIVLNSELTIDVINFNAYNKIQEVLAVKAEPIIIPGKIRNMFVYGPLAVATSTPTTSTPKN